MLPEKRLKTYRIRSGSDSLGAVRCAPCLVGGEAATTRAGKYAAHYMIEAVCGGCPHLPTIRLFQLIMPEQSYSDPRGIVGQNCLWVTQQYEKYKI